MGLNSPIVNMFIDNMKIMGMKRSDVIMKIKVELITGFFDDWYKLQKLLHELESWKRLKKQDNQAFLTCLY